MCVGSGRLIDVQLATRVRDEAEVAHGARLISSNVPHGVILEHGSRLPLVCCAARSARVRSAGARVPSIWVGVCVREMRRRRRRRCTGYSDNSVHMGARERVSEQPTIYLHARVPRATVGGVVDVVVVVPRPRHQTTNAICRRRFVCAYVAIRAHGYI